jgi:formyl-CoA transferase
MYLGDQGAEVIKVEPLGGDAARGWGVSPLLTGTSKSFLAINRNKRGIAVDLRQPDGQKLVHQLVKDADVVVVNIRTPLRRVWASTTKPWPPLAPRLVYAAVLGYGDRGPYAAQPSYDSVVQGMSGAMHRTLPDGTPIAALAYTSRTVPRQ